MKLLLFVLFFIIRSANAADMILFSDKVLYTADSFGPTNIKADSMCYAISEETIIPPYSCANIFALLSYNSSYQIADFPSKYGFPTAIPVRSPTFSTIGVWSFMMANPPTVAPSLPATVMSLSLVEADVLRSTTVISPYTRWWSGSDISGTVSTNTCSQWTDYFGSGKAGLAEFRSTVWINGPIESCSTPYQFVCACVTGIPTLKPTNQPTYTSSPTKDPTKNPTINPTKSPLIRVDKQQVMYKIPKGTKAKIYGLASNNITFYVMGSDVNTPMNMTLSATNVLPVLWENVYWLKYNQTTASVSTELTPLCNPIANRAPGTVVTTFHQYPLCPTIYSCIDGQLNTISGGVYQDYRACILNKTVIGRSDVPNLNNAKVTLSALDVDASTTSPIIIQDIFVGRIRCNDFIDRTINCQLKYFFNSSYRLQCTNDGIGCYTYAQGRFFGGLWNANPFYRYDIPRVNWTLSQYVGIASVMNYNIYARNGQFIDAFTSNVWNDYFWLGGVTSLNIQRSEVFSYAFTFQNDYIQGQEYNYVAGTLLPPVTASMVDEPFTSSIINCVVQIIFTGNLSGICENQDWDHITYAQWRLPSYIRYIEVQPGAVVYSLTIQTQFNYTAIEVYNNFGELCGIYAEPTGFQNITVSCLQTPSAFIAAPAATLLQVRYFGVHAIWDIPNATLSNSVPPHESDAFTISGYPFLTSVINLLYSVLYFTVYTVNGVIQDDEFNWPGRRNNISTLVESRYFLNYTLNTTLDFAQTLESVRQGILVNNTYPYNYALAAWVARNQYQSIPVNYSDPYHLQWLYYIWANSMPPRQCTEYSNCMTFGRGKCIFPESPEIQYSGGVKPVYWLQGDDPPGYTIPNSANEGGCFIYSVYSRGFYDRQLAGARCKEGYGPFDNENYLQILQYSVLVADVGAYAGSNCKLPAWFDPISSPLVDYNICAGHGKAQTSQSNQSRTITQYSDGGQWLFPTCDSILLDQDEYVRQPVTSVYIQQFVF